MEEDQAEKSVASIKKQLESLQSSANYFLSIYHHCREAEHEVFNFSLDALGFFHGVMDMAVDIISAELGLLRYEGKPHAKAYVRKPQAAAPGGAV